MSWWRPAVNRGLRPVHPHAQQQQFVFSQDTRFKPGCSKARCLHYLSEDYCLSNVPPAASCKHQVFCQPASLFFATSQGLTDAENAICFLRQRAAFCSFRSSVRSRQNQEILEIACHRLVASVGLIYHQMDEADLCGVPD